MVLILLVVLDAAVLLRTYIIILLNLRRVQIAADGVLVLAGTSLLGYH